MTQSKRLLAMLFGSLLLAACGGGGAKDLSGGGGNDDGRGQQACAVGEGFHGDNSFEVNIPF